MKEIDGAVARAGGRRSRGLSVALGISADLRALAGFALGHVLRAAFWKEQDEQAKQNQFAHFTGASQIKRRTTASEKLRAPADVRSDPVALLPSWQAVVMKSSQPTPRGA